MSIVAITKLTFLSNQKAKLQTEFSGNKMLIVYEIRDTSTSRNFH